MSLKQLISKDFKFKRIKYWFKRSCRIFFEDLIRANNEIKKGLFGLLCLILIITILLINILLLLPYGFVATIEEKKIELRKKNRSKL